MKYSDCQKAYRFTISTINQFWGWGKKHMNVSHFLLLKETFNPSGRFRFSCCVYVISWCVCISLTLNHIYYLRMPLNLLERRENSRRIGVSDTNALDINWCQCGSANILQYLVFTIETFDRLFIFLVFINRLTYGKLHLCVDEGIRFTSICHFSIYHWFLSIDKFIEKSLPQSIYS